MPSYKIYRISESFDLKSLFSSKWLEDIKPIRGELEAVNQKIDGLKKNLKSTTMVTNKNLADNAYTIKYQYNMQLPGKTQVWVPEDINLIQKDILLYISRGQGGIRYLAEKHLNNNIDIIPKDFKPKKLIKIWKNLRNHCLKEGYDIKLHRMILYKVYLEGELIKELNLSTDDLHNLGYFNQLIQDSEHIRVITFRIRWNIADSEGNRMKDLTARLDSSGNLLIYGNHSKESINKLLIILSNSVN